MIGVLKRYLYAFAVCSLAYLLDNIFIRLGTKLYKQIAGIPMGTNSALFYFEGMYDVVVVVHLNYS